MRYHIENPSENWIGVGKTLGASFNYDPTVLIATTAAGAIPFYSRLETVDMLGLNDKWVARNGLPVGNRPGHQRLAPFSYLLSRGVNLVISHPHVISRTSAPPQNILFSDALKEFHVPFTDQDTMPGNAKLVEIPIDDKYAVLVLYLTPHPLIDQAIQKNNWRWAPLA